MQIWLPKLSWSIAVVLALVWSVALPVFGLMEVAQWWR